MDNETNTDQEICGDLSTPDSFSRVWADLMNILVSLWIFIFSVFQKGIYFLILNNFFIVVVYIMIIINIILVIISIIMWMFSVYLYLISI